MHSPTLFHDLEEPAESIEAPPDGPFAAVALEQGIDRTLDYAIPPSLAGSLQVGQRVRVPLGKNNRPTNGYVVAIHPTTDYPRIKNVLAVADQRVLVPPKLMELARWMSRYYCAPLGAVLESVLPSAVRKQIGIGYAQMVRPVLDRATMQQVFEKTKAPKRRAILARLLLLQEGGAIELVRLASEAGATAATVRKLVRLGLITITSEVDLPRLTDTLQPA